MELGNLKTTQPAGKFQADQILASYYGRLMQWASALARGDKGKAEEIVQEFCLYITLAKPDLTEVVNLDGYLYTCLRHIYLSGLARASREAMHCVSIEDFDSFAFAVSANPIGDPLQRQNDLRRICAYTVWRKESSKSASYFILHFFHGYGRMEIADLARLPISAIYNKLKTARSEVKLHLEEPGKLRVVSRSRPPEPALSWRMLSSLELFKELRQTIVQARNSDCLPEEELLAHYRSSIPYPISCSLLAHIVSCERCLAMVDRHLRRPTLKDREPLDCFGTGPDIGNEGAAGPGGITQKAMLQAVRKRWGRVQDHRPRTLSIAVNGQIVAFHDVHAEHSKLSARIERPENAMFVEVFSEQDVRLALLPIGELPPVGLDVRTQRVELSDARWLELSLTFDGLGLNSQVAYFDPTLAAEQAEDDEEESPALVPMGRDFERASEGWFGQLNAAFRRMLRAGAPSSAFAWALILAVILGSAGYFVYHRATANTDAVQLLNQSVSAEAAALEGQTEHQVMNIEEVSSSGAVLQQGVVDLWKDGDGNRYLRRLFDAKHRMVAAEWRNKNGEHSLLRKEDRKPAPEGNRPPLMSGLWDQDLSARAFRAMRGQAPRVRPFEDGYELTTTGPIEGRPQLVSATLVLDRHLVPVRTILRVRSGADVHELRFVQTSYERRPRTSVPDAVFDPDYFTGVRDLHSSGSHGHALPGSALPDSALAELQIAILYQLNRLDADSSQPIEVARTSEGPIRVSGAIADDALKGKIVTQLQALPGHGLIDLKLFSPQEVKRRTGGAPRLLVRSTSVYEISQERVAADATLRKYFQAKGISGDQLDAAVAQFSHDVLDHAQRALQNAYALDRLGSALSATELQSIKVSSQQQWTEMIDKHARALEEQLRMLDRQLAEISGGQAPDREGLPGIGDPAQFKQAAGRLLRQTQDLNRDVGGAFTSRPLEQQGQGVQWAAMVHAIPLRQAEEIARFGVQLRASAASVEGGNHPSTPGQTR